MVQAGAETATPTPEQDLSQALDQLEQGLAITGGAVSRIRAVLPQVADLSGVVRDLEGAIARARQELSAPRRGAGSSEGAIRLVGDPFTAGPSSAEGQRTLEATERVWLQVDVASGSGQLDLKSVDAAMNEHSSVNDVVLVDYDGHKAIFKVWVESEDVSAVRESLYDSLLHHLSADPEADIRIESIRD